MPTYRTIYQAVPSIKQLLLFCCLLSLFLGTTVQAQEKVELFNSLEQIGPLKTLHKTFDLEAGENLIVSVTPMKGLLWRLTIDIPNSDFQYINKKIEKLDRALITVAKSGTYAFHFTNGNLFKKDLDIKIYKQRGTVDKDTLYLHDVVFSAFRDTIKKYRDDTIPVPDLAEYEFVLNPGRNYGAVSDSTILEELLKDEETEYQYAAYWIGLGTESIAAYNELKANPPANWRIMGINEPLMAYGLGVTNLLPLSSSSIARDVMFKFMNPEEYNSTDRKPRLTRRDKRGDFYGRIPISSASKYKELLLSVRNFNTTTGIPVYVKFVKFKLDRVYFNEYIVRERVQEVFREKTLKMLKPEEG
ncbi:MAG: hypothetical protein ACRBFS_24995 [Aureispira sp.]